MERYVPYLAILAILVLVPTAIAHSDRTVQKPDGDDGVPTYSTDGPALVVCPEGSTAGDFDLERNQELVTSCQYHVIQEAVNDVDQRGTRILVLPGHYTGTTELSVECQETVEHAYAEDRGLNYEEHSSCPTAKSLVGVFGDDPADEGIECGDDADEVLCDLQIEGTGEDPSDVVIDAEFAKEFGIRVDRADGFYLTNVTVQRGHGDSFLAFETDGVVAENVLARWNPGYALNAFAVDHLLFTDCEAVGSGDAGIYLGAMPELRGVRPTGTVEDCNVHHNAIGYSGTAGNSVLVRDTAWHHNGAGIVMDSVFPNHPGQPQDSAKYVGNEIYSNNVNYYDNFLGEDAPCDKPVEDQGWSDGVVCPVAPVPVGTGIMIAGGNDNVIAQNTIYDNWRYGAMIFSVPKVFRQAQAATGGGPYGGSGLQAPDAGAANQLETSHNNKFLFNTMGVDPAGNPAPNGIDFWWDEGGSGNCWEANDGGADGIESNPIAPLLPDCEGPGVYRPINLGKTASIVSCATYSEDNHHPIGCRWMYSPEDPSSEDDEVLGWDPEPQHRVSEDTTFPS